MKNFYTLLIGLLAFFGTAFAQTDRDYYLDISQNNTKYWFSWDASEGCYVLTMDELWGNFIIYSSSYVQGGNDQNNLIFGADPNNQYGAGVMPDSDMTLAHPGNSMSIQGGSMLYNVTLKFWPDELKLQIVGGSYERPEPTDPAVSITGTGTAISPESGTVDFTVTTTKIDSPETLTYTVTAYYKAAGASDYTAVPQTVTGSSLTGAFTFNDLTIGSTTDVYLLVTTEYNSSTLYDVAMTSITTPEVPILIGQIPEGSWQPNIGIEGTKIGDGVYRYMTKFTGDGEFSFVSKLGTSSTDWTTVNAHPRYAPSSNRVDAPLDTWLGYTVYSGSTENAWKLDDPTYVADETGYVVEFDFNTKSIKVYREEGLTGVDTATAQERVVDVYTLQGTLVRTGVKLSQAGAGLPAGIYVAGGRKLLVR